MALSNTRVASELDAGRERDGVGEAPLVTLGVGMPCDGRIVGEGSGSLKVRSGVGVRSARGRGVCCATEKVLALDCMFAADAS